MIENIEIHGPKTEKMNLKFHLAIIYQMAATPKNLEIYRESLEALKKLSEINDLSINQPLPFD